FTLHGYTGPVLNGLQLLAASPLVTGGPERDFQLGLLTAEAQLGKATVQSLIEAIGTYTKLLPAATSTHTTIFNAQLDLFQEFTSNTVQLTPRQRFVAIRSAFAHLELGDQFFRTKRVLSDDERE